MNIQRRLDAFQNTETSIRGFASIQEESFELKVGDGIGVGMLGWAWQ